MAETSYTTQTLLSFAQWLDNRLLDRGQQYINVNTRLYYQPDPSISGQVCYAAPFRSFVWDSGADGAIIFDGFSGYFFNSSGYTSSGSQNIYTGITFPQVGITGNDGLPLTINFDTGAYVSLVSGIGLQSGNSFFFTDSIAQTGVVRISGSGSNTYTDIPIYVDGLPPTISKTDWNMTVDYVNGRIMLPSPPFTSDMLISGTYAVKGFNLYFSNQSQERIVFSNKYYLNSRFNRSITGIPPPRSFVTPCIFITSPGEENEPASFGGLYNTKTQVSLIVMGETLAQTQSALDLVRDANQVSFPQLPVSSSPIGPLGDLKQGYNYSLLASQYNQPGNLCTISNVRTSLLSDSVRIDQSIFLGIAEMTVEKMRTIH